MALTTKLLECFYSIEAAPGYCLNPGCTKSRNKQYTEPGYIMHMRASPSCCRFALRLGKQLVTPRGACSNPSMIGGDDKKNATNAKKKSTIPPPAENEEKEEDPIIVTMTPIVRGDNSTISALTEIQFEAVPIPGVRCPNPNCPKSKTKRYTDRGYVMHMRAFASCDDYIAMALWLQYRRLMDAHEEKPAKRTVAHDDDDDDEEDSNIMTPIRDNDPVLSDDGDYHSHAGQHSCPNPHCPKSKCERYSNHEYGLHMNASTSCFMFIACAIRNHGRVVSPTQE